MRDRAGEWYAHACECRSKTACTEDDLSRNPVAPGDKPRLVDFADAAARRTIGRQLQTDKADELLVVCGSVKPPAKCTVRRLGLRSLSEETYLFVGSQVRALRATGCGAASSFIVCRGDGVDATPSPRRLDAIAARAPPSRHKNTQVEGDSDDDDDAGGQVVCAPKSPMPYLVLYLHQFSTSAAAARINEF